MLFTALMIVLDNVAGLSVCAFEGSMERVPLLYMKSVYYVTVY
mgnify:CR=1 FL=1